MLFQFLLTSSTELPPLSEPAALLSPLPELLAIVLAEIVFSVSNILAIDSYARELPERKRRRALKWGFTGAVTLRVFCLLLMTFVKSFHWVLILASIHGLLASALWFLGISSHEHAPKPPSFIPALKQTPREDMSFFRSLFLIELADICFSFENVAIAVSISKVLWVSISGVVVGLLIVRFLWRLIRRLVKKYPRLADTSEIVSGLIGLQILPRLIFGWKPAPWLDLLTVIGAIVICQCINIRALGKQVKLKLTAVVVAAVLVLKMLFSSTGGLM